MWSYPRCASAVYQQDSKAFPIKSAETWLQKAVPSNISLIIWFHDLLRWFRDFNRMLHWLGFKCDINLIGAYSSSRSWENRGKSALQSGSWSTGKLGKSILSVTTRLGHSDHTIKMAVISRVCPYQQLWALANVGSLWLQARVLWVGRKGDHLHIHLLLPHQAWASVTRACVKGGLDAPWG